MKSITFNTRSFGFLLFGLLLLVKCQNKSQQEELAPESQENSLSARGAALKGYELLHRAQSSGAFKSFQAIELGDSIAKLGDSIPVYYIGVDKLGDFSSEQNTSNLAEYGDEIIYTLKSEGTVQSGIVVKKKGSKWQFSGLISKEFSNSVDSLRSEVIDSNFQKQVYLLNIPALYLSFIATDSADDISLASLTESQTLGITEGGKYKARSLFEDIGLKLKANSIKLLSPETFKPRPKE